jgi:hypothetical protein
MNRRTDVVQLSGCSWYQTLGPDSFGNTAKDDRRRENERDHASNEYDDTYGVHHMHVSLFELWVSS